MLPQAAGGLWGDVEGEAKVSTTEMHVKNKG